MRHFLTEFALVGLTICFGLILLGFCGKMLARGAAAIRPYLAAFIIFTFAVMNFAQKSGTNEPPRSASSGRVESFDGRVERVEGPTGSTRSAGLNTQAPCSRLESETTNETYSYAMPINATRYEKWWRRGAYEDVFELDLDGLLFPFGEYLCDSLWVYSWGMAGRSLADASNRVVATGVPMSAVPGVSRFWSAEAADGGRLLTWENFFLDRNTNTPVSAQLELMPSGDYIARSNLVERLYRRVNPDDWDDDGIPNDDDLDPYFYDGDNFGPHQELPQGANSNAYCWVDLVVPNANALVTFTGDGPSALPDPAFIAKAGETNRVILLIGKTYQVASKLPITCVGQSSSEIEVYQNQDSPTEMYICWPVVMESSSMRSGSSFSMSVWPDCLGGGFAWTNCCCQVASLGGWHYSISCGNNCLCSGCGAEGYYEYEAYRLPAVGGSCGCWSDGEVAYGHDGGGHPAGISVSFSKDAVIFENRYENSPGVWVERRSTKVELTCVAHGGPNGGCATFLITGGNRLISTGGLPLPVIRNVPAGTRMSFKVSYEGQLASSTVDDVVVNAYFDDNNPNVGQKTAEAVLTAVEVEIMRQNDTPENSCDYRHKFGVNERFNCNCWPSSANVSFSAGALSPVSGSQGGFLCPLYAVEKPLAISYGGSSYTPNISVVEPSGIQVRNPIVVPYINSPGRAGWVGLRQEFYVLPMDVAFPQIAVQEVPSTQGTHTGYFENSSFSPIWCHSVANGAGVWCRINPTTHRMGEHDTARITMELRRVDGSGNLTDDPAYGWANGEITWAVPFGWGIADDNPELLQTTTIQKQFDPSAGHRFQIVPNGTVSVRKFGNEATRDIQGNLYLNGVPFQ